MRETFLPYALPSIGEDEIAEVVDSLRSGWVTTGPKTKHFEEDFARYTGASNAIAVNSCTAGLHIGLTALGVGPGDEVILPTLTFCATANVVVQLGARPVLVDVCEDYNIDPAAVEAAITPRTKVIMPVHFGGQASDLNILYDIARKHGLSILEDAAHAVGAAYHGHYVGADAFALKGVPVITSFSFYATKNLTTGEGGMVTTPDGVLAEKMRLLALHGMSRDAWKRYTSQGSWYYEVVLPGYKYNMTDIQAALGIHQLRKLDQFIAVRQEYARAYNEAFADVGELSTPVIRPDRNHVYHLYVLRLCLERLRIDRAAFINGMRNANIGTSVHFIPVHMHPFYRETYGYRQGEFPRAESLYKAIVSLPLYPAMTPADVEDTIAAVKEIVEANRR